MNTLIIIGNGFDLAHDLPTSYGHFLDDFWSKLRLRYEEPSIRDIIYINPEFFRVLTINAISNFENFINNLKEYSKEYGCYYDENNLSVKDRKGSGSKIIVQFNNQLFKNLNKNNSLKKWVDIENEYYALLKKISRQKPKRNHRHQLISEEEQFENNRKAALQLNNEFDQIKKLLQNYLKQNVEEKFDFENKPINPFPLVEHFKLKSNLVKSKFNESLLEKKHLDDDYDNISLSQETDDFNFLNCFLNFNYTSSLFPYIYNYFGNFDHGRAVEIKIHGSVYDEINFGFGDEMDDDYKLIENLNENIYLKNFKSFGYTKNASYRRLIDFIDSQKFKLYIMGHSCGISDRILLNTIFEHKNCESIQIFYHKKRDGTDNFTTIVQNMSRHFNDKKMMRSKIINKELCSPLPQSIRFNKRNTEIEKIN